MDKEGVADITLCRAIWRRSYKLIIFTHEADEYEVWNPDAVLMHRLARAKCPEDIREVMSWEKK